MIKKRMTVFLIMSFMLSLSIDARADESEDTKSQAEIKITAGEGPVPPIDPDNPLSTDRLPSPEKIPKDQVRGLQINYVSPLDFGQKTTISQTVVEVHAKNDVTPFFQVSDLRGKGEGWALKISLTPFKSVTDPLNIIKGASIVFQHPQVVTNNLDGSDAPSVSDRQELVAGTEGTVIMEAKPNTGRGTWALAYPKDNQRDEENTNIIFKANSRYIDVDTDYEAKMIVQLFDGPSPD